MKFINPLATLLVFAFLSSTAAAAPTDSQLFSQCKAMVTTQYADSKVKLLKMKNRRGNFEATMRVITDEGRANYVCNIDKGEVPQLVRLDAETDSLAAKK